jgi:hypothetical protein
MFEILIYNDLKPGKARKQLDKALEQLSRGDFASSEVKKMANNGFFRAKLDYENRLLFKFGRYQDQTCLLALEVILNHNYDKSRFLRGCKIDESKLIPLKGVQEITENEFVPLSYINKKHPHFHLLDKVLSFDDDQDNILSLSLPQIIVGSAGSGKTALTLEKTKSLTGKVLYVTLSPYLAENSARLFYSNDYENDELEIDFLSYREFIETLRVPESKEFDFRMFEGWFSRYKQATKLKDAHKTFEEFRGVITGWNIQKEYLSPEDYYSLGVKQSIFLASEREMVYPLFEKYLHYLKENNFYDINILSHQWQSYCAPLYDFIVIDEVQDLTNIQLHLILRSLKTPANFMLCGDSNQVVYPNFFSWSHLKSMFYQSDLKGDEIKILSANYRNSQTISELANRLLKIKYARFGSIDKESNYLVSTVSETKGEVAIVEDKGTAIADLARKTKRSVKYAVLVLRNEDKGKAKQIFQTPLIFSVQESKGLEYENIILYNFITDNAPEFKAICEGVTETDLLVEELAYARTRNKTDKSLETYKFYVNSLYVAITRAIRNVYITEKDKEHKLIGLLNISDQVSEKNIQEEVSSADEWKREARRLEMQGKTEQADAIRKNILVTENPNWEPVTLEVYKTLKKEAMDPENFNKKAKDSLFDFALIHNQYFLLEKLAELKYKRAENYEVERGSLFRKYYQHYKEDNLKMIIPSIQKYGIDYRDVHNFTPLHAASFSGSVNITRTLLENGANPALLDTFYKTPIQIALSQAFVLPDYARNKLGKIYPLLLTDSIKVQVDNQLIKIDAHKFEYLLINLLIAVQVGVLQKKQFFDARGIGVDDLVVKIKNFSETVLPAFRKKREYLSSILAKHEMNSNNPYNKKILERVTRGYYVLNPNLQLWINEQWISVTDIHESNDITLEELFKHNIERAGWEAANYRKKVAKEQKDRERREQRMKGRYK